MFFDNVLFLMCLLNENNDIMSYLIKILFLLIVNLYKNYYCLVFYSIFNSFDIFYYRLLLGFLYCGIFIN